VTGFLGPERSGIARLTGESVGVARVGEPVGLQMRKQPVSMNERRKEVFVAGTQLLPFHQCLGHAGKPLMRKAQSEASSRSSSRAA
jgi:hypothetical protein